MVVRLVTPLLALLACVLPLVAQQQDRETAYPVDDLNAGLTALPDFVDRATPRATMETLLYLAAREEWQAAAHLLNLNAFPADAQPERGPELARKLHTVIQRKAVIDWSDLRDRPDGLDAEASDRSAIGAEPRKSILLWQLALPNHPAAIRLNRVLPGDGDPVWVFSAQTVQNIDALHDIYGPSDLERSLPDFWREEGAIGLLRWEIVGLPVLLLLAIGTGILTHRLLGRIAVWVDGRLLGDILRDTRNPATFGAMTGVVYAVTSTVFVFSGKIDTLLGPMVWIGLLGSALWLIVNVIENILDRVVDFGEDLTQRQEQRHRVIATRIAAGRRALVVLVALLGAGIFFSSTNLMQNLGWSLLGTAGALTLILGFAARRVLGNIMSSMQIALNQSAKIGDRVVFKDHLCHVERINFTYVQLRDWTGTRLIVPVEEFAATEFENWTLQEPELLRLIKLKLSPEVDIDLLRDIFDKVIADLDPDELADLHDAKVYVADQDVFGVDIWFALPCADPNSSWDVACKAREGILRRLRKHARKTDVEVFPNATPAEAA